MSLAASMSPDLSTGCFLPHHGVWKGSGCDAKIRVVFNGSARTLSGDSLNDCLHSGPNLLPALCDVVTLWRRHRFVVVSDIEKMYRQILVHPDDRDLQRILWLRDNQVAEFQLNTVTYGLASAPYLAIRVLRQLADDEGARFPLAAEALRRSTYMDDILAGAPSLSEAKRLQTQLTELCMAGGFPLRKWAANHEHLLLDVPLKHRSGPSSDTVFYPADHSVLGLRWDPRSDCFALTVRPSDARTVTKRTLLSASAQLFDPMGWLAPITVRAKLLIQTTWLQQLDWDAPLAAEEANSWSKLREELPLLADVRIPRWMRCDVADCSVEIHGFADASERAYAAVVYLRSTNNGEVHMSLVMAKTKVSPLRKVSLPRLELCAGALLARIVAHTRSTLELTTSAAHLWTDSTVALSWIRSHPARWTTFVANRVAEIQRLVPVGQWHHVPGKDNPADCASRGMSPRELLAHELWWHAPTFLRKDVSAWPTDPGRPSSREVPEQRLRTCTVASGVLEPAELTRFSSLPRLLRVTAWMCRWLPPDEVLVDARNEGFSSTNLGAKEIQLALVRWLRVVQKHHFRAELDNVTAGLDVQGRSTL